MTCSTPDRLEILKAARRVADFASTQGVPSSYLVSRSTYQHAGALLADAVLQAGLSYRSVVMPRIERILKEFPDANRISSLVRIIEKDGAAYFLDWTHLTKVKRFEQLVDFFCKKNIENVKDIRDVLKSDAFCYNLKLLNGIGPKTVDYMACLVGIESVAVDRHIKNFAEKAGIINYEYDFLKGAFCFAADLLCISRREFDAWVWSHEVNGSSQMKFAF